MLQIISSQSAQYSVMVSNMEKREFWEPNWFQTRRLVLVVDLVLVLDQKPLGITLPMKKLSPKRLDQRKCSESINNFNFLVKLCTFQTMCLLKCQLFYLSQIGKQLSKTSINVESLGRSRQLKTKYVPFSSCHLYISKT